MSANTLLTSVLNGGSNSHATVAEEANAFSTDFVSAGVVGTIGVNAGSGGTGSFCVNADASPDMGVTIKAGQAYVTATPSGQNSQVLRVRAAADYTAYTINANASGSTKYDWVYLSISATNANTPSSDASNVASFVTSRSSSNTTDNGSPPTYGLVLAVITVANGASSITNGNIQDKRVGSSLTTATASSSTGWNALGQVPNTVAANGNRSYTLTFNAIDITGTVSNGMRLKTSRTVAAPTQCTSLNGTTQYYSKTTPAGYAFTDSFTYSAWVKPTSYALGTIIGRFSTTGSMLQMNANGQLLISAKDAGTTDSALTYQSLPLNKWSHVAMTMVVATNTVTAYIDGVAVPTAYTNGTTTAVTQAGNLEIGGNNGGTNPFPGKIAQAAVYSAVLSQATIQSYISQGLAGTETSLISAYSFNNSINDLNANANNLTANGSAVATNADSPFGGQAGGSISSTLDYGIITSASFSTNTTLVVQVPEGCTIPTSGGVSAVSYATNGIPYGFPKQRAKWEVRSEYYATDVITFGSLNNYAPLNEKLNIPIGEWVLKPQGPYRFTSSGAGTRSGFVAIAASTPTALASSVVAPGTMSIGRAVAFAATDAYAFASGQFELSLAAATAYTVYAAIDVSNATETFATLGAQGGFAIIAENAYL